MNSWTHGWRAALGIGVVMLAGCYMNRPYGPGYYNAGPMYGPTYSAPQYMSPSPGPVYTPQNLGPTPMGPTLNSPTPISPTPSQTGPTWRPDPNSGLDNAPPFQPNNSNNRVPDPLDADFSAPPGAANVPRATAISPVAGTAPAMFPGNEPDPFEKPMPVQPLLKPAGSASPYSYDGDKYTFVKGIVDFDQASQTWSIIYDLQPRDRFGGSFIFAPHPQLQTLKPGDLVLAKGRVDPGRTDARGKELYEIGTLTVLPPLPGAQ